MARALDAHEAEELRAHDRATIPELTARHVIGDLLASGPIANDRRLLLPLSR
jgi:hypothetical protein